MDNEKIFRRQLEMAKTVFKKIRDEDTTREHVRVQAVQMVDLILADPVGGKSWT